MRKNSLLLALTCALAVMLMAGRCTDDDEKAKSESNAAHEAAPADAATVGKDVNDVKDGKDAVDSGVETDPLGETIGGPDDMAAPSDDINAPGGDDIGIDDPTFEPESTPDEPTDL